MVATVMAQAFAKTNRPEFVEAGKRVEKALEKDRDKQKKARRTFKKDNGFFSRRTAEFNSDERKMKFLIHMLNSFYFQDSVDPVVSWSKDQLKHPTKCCFCQSDLESQENLVKLIGKIGESDLLFKYLLKDRPTGSGALHAIKSKQSSKLICPFCLQLLRNWGFMYALENKTVYRVINRLGSVKSEEE